MTRSSPSDIYPKLFRQADKPEVEFSNSSSRLPKKTQVSRRSWLRPRYHTAEFLKGKPTKRRADRKRVDFSPLTGTSKRRRRSGRCLLPSVPRTPGKPGVYYQELEFTRRSRIRCSRRLRRGCTGSLASQRSSSRSSVERTPPIRGEPQGSSRFRSQSPRACRSVSQSDRPIHNA